MNTNLIEKVAGEMKLKPAQVASVIQLLFDEECTIPFVARYRKEMTGSLDEVVLRDVRDRFHYLAELESSKLKYLKVVEEHCQKNPAFAGKFEDLKKRFMACKTRQELEDLYLPFKPKRRTRAQVAKEKGLEPLLEQILAQRGKIADLLALAGTFVTPAGKDVAPELVVADAAAALAGAADIFAERINETADFRSLVRRISIESGQLTAKRIEDKAEKGVKVEKVDKDGVKEIEIANDPAARLKAKKGDASKYENYFDYKEPIKNAPSHRIMAVRRGESEKILRVGIEVDETQILAELTTTVLGKDVATDGVKKWMIETIEDAYRRLMGPSIETELRLQLKSTAEDEAINVFSKNLSNLLLLPPIPGKAVLGVDPGIRTGSKLAAVDETGKLLGSATIYPNYKHETDEKTKQAKLVVAGFVDKFKVQCIACGNGTGSREIDRFISGVLKENNVKNVSRAVVNEAGASVYSTDEIAREEFPDLDPTIRSAVSIARRLQDPLAELVKINPRSIGVGQYQHDLNPTKLGRSLEEVVESCVNKVGVNLNTASYKLLGYVSGVGPQLAKSIVSYRDKNGKFETRDQVLKVSGFGPKAYQQAAGFLRVPESPNPLDNSSVHPERYDIVEMVAKDLKKPLGEIVGKKELVEAIPWERYVSQAIGMPTLQDIASELIKPGRDPREDGARLLFSDEVSGLEDLKPGMALKGTVTNVTNFGAFVDIGVHQDGLVHISELSDQFVKDPASVVAVGDILNVRVLEVDVQRKRISLSCKTQSAPRPAGEQQPRQQQQAQPNRPRDGQRPQGGQGPRGDHRGGGDRGRDNRPDNRNDGRGENRGMGHSSGQPSNARPQHSTGGGRQDQKPAQSFTMDDLMSKFGKGK